MYYRYFPFPKKHTIIMPKTKSPSFKTKSQKYSFKGIIQVGISTKVYLKMLSNMLIMLVAVARISDHFAI